MTETNLGMAMKNVFLGGNVISDWFWLLEQNRVQEIYACIFSPAISPHYMNLSKIASLDFQHPF